MEKFKRGQRSLEGRKYEASLNIDGMDKIYVDLDFVLNGCGLAFIEDGYANLCCFYGSNLTFRIDFKSYRSLKLWNNQISVSEKKKILCDNAVGMVNPFIWFGSIRFLSERELLSIEFCEKENSNNFNDFLEVVNELNKYN